MTTIVYRDGVLAADNAESFGDMRLPSLNRKVHRLRDGRLFAWTGDAGIGVKVLAHLNDPKQAAPDIDGKGYAIIVDRAGRIFVYEQNAMVRERAPYIARGSGMRFAYGALAMGADARRAVEVAILFDSNSGRGVSTIRLRR